MIRLSFNNFKWSAYWVNPFTPEKITSLNDITGNAMYYIISSVEAEETGKNMLRGVTEGYGSWVAYGT